MSTTIKQVRITVITQLLHCVCSRPQQHSQQRQADREDWRAGSMAKISMSHMKSKLDLEQCHFSEDHMCQNSKIDTLPNTDTNQNY